MKDKSDELQNLIHDSKKRGFLFLHKQLFGQPKKYFVLSKDCTLNYFNEKKEFSSRKKINITSDVKVKESPEKEETGKYTLEIETKHRTYKLSTNSEFE